MCVCASESVRPEQSWATSAQIPEWCTYRHPSTGLLGNNSCVSHGCQRFCFECMCHICVVNMLTRPFTFQERGMSRDRKPVKPVC